MLKEVTINSLQGQGISRLRPSVTATGGESLWELVMAGTEQLP